MSWHHMLLCIPVQIRRTRHHNHLRYHTRVALEYIDRCDIGTHFRDTSRFYNL